MKKTAVVTIASENYFAQVQTLLTSLMETNPKWDRFFAVVDEPDDDLMEALKITNTKLIKMDEINIPDLDDMKFRYDIMELNTAIKPFVLLKLMEEYECVVYLDPDIRVYKELEEVNNAFDQGYEFVVTPHFTGYWEEDGKHPNEPDIMSAGVYNFGFFAAAACDNARKVIGWWAKKLETLCINKQTEGIFVDQKWMDLLPGRHDKVFILRDEGYNVAYWNLSHRKADYIEGQYYFNGYPLKFFHFSGYNPKTPDNISKHQNRFSMDQIGVAKKLFYDYAKITIGNNYDEWRKKTYSYNKFSDGRDLKDLFRFLYREDSEVYQKMSGRNPFDCSDIFYDQKEWLMPHVINYIVSNRKELALYLINTKRDAWVRWLAEVLQNEYKLDDEWVEYAIAFYSNHLAGFLDEKIETPNIPQNCTELTDGVNLIGYIRSEHGVGEACRLTADALNETGIVWTAYDWEMNNPSRKTDNTWNYKIKSSINHNISIFNINADQMPVAKAQLPRSAWDGYRIGIWYWELTEFPEQWCKAFDLVDEIWAPTRFIQENLLKKSTVPVLYMPPGIRREEPKAEYDREYFNLPSNTFLFLNFFDAFSYTSRKNPSATVRAFQMAFEPDDMSVGLVLKINNIDKDSEEYKVVCDAKAGYKNIYVIAKTMTRDEINGLINICDASVSLHRSEGLGLLCQESMYFGKPVIATNWSGNTDFMTEETACLVNYTMVPIEEYYGTNEPNQLWAEPDVCHASHYMERLVKDVDYYNQISHNAKEYIRSEFSPSVCGARMNSRIQEILSNKSEWINNCANEQASNIIINYNDDTNSIKEKWELCGEIERIEERTGQQSPEVINFENERLYLNKEWDVEHFFYDLSGGNIVKKIFKKVMRKLIGFMIHPIVHSQSMINASIARAFNELENQNNVLRQEFLNLQKIQVSYNGDLMQSINDLNAKNKILQNKDVRQAVQVQEINENIKNIEKINENVRKLEKSNEMTNSCLNDINSGILGLANELETIKKIETETAEHYIQVSGSLYNAMYQRVTSIDRTLAEKNNGDGSVILEKEFVENKWKLIDKFYQEPEIMKCSICEKKFKTGTAEQILAEDIYGGGKLIRYRCPSCGAIVGPNKMWDLSEDELSEEYKYHYMINSEGQTTDAEIETFMDMQPEKGKRYLNYGCGAWTSTIEKLREQGYDVYGFDPYAPCESDFIITDFDELREQKFDGVFSHDLLEHLRYPVETFKLFSEILNKDGIMAHSTACYKYVYEYDRFHLVFYTGNSVNVLCDKTGFDIIEKLEDNDYLTYNYIYKKRMLSKMM